jgi:hypothetical protein
MQAPVVRSPLVCRAAAAAEINADVAEQVKGGVAHLRFQRGSVHKVRQHSGPAGVLQQQRLLQMQQQHQRQQEEET